MFYSLPPLFGTPIFSSRYPCPVPLCICSLSLKDRYQYKCCNPNADVESVSNGGGSSGGTPSLPAYVGPIGTNPDCPICGSAEYPGNPRQLVVARYVGAYTCDQLFTRGFHGMTPGYMCGPLQDFSYMVCGCGQYNPVCRADSTKCWGGRNYRAPYIIPFDTGISSGSSVASANNGARHLRGGAQQEQLDASIVVSTTSIPPGDLHFESKDPEAAPDVQSSLKDAIDLESKVLDE
jgi:hypothetical protein